MTIIDERARRAATDVHVAVAEATPRELPSRPRVLRPAAVVGAVLLVALAAWFAVRGRHDDAADIRTEPAPALTPLVPAEVPAGLQPTLAIEGGEGPAGIVPWEDVAIWGVTDPDPTSPWLTHSEFEGTVDRQPGEPVTVGPYDGDHTEDPATGKRWVFWSADGVNHQVEGTNVSRDEIVAAAAAIAVGDNPTGGLSNIQLVYRGPLDLLYATQTPGLALAPDSWLVAYTSGKTEPVRGLAVSGGTRPGLVDALRVMGSAGQAVSVRGGTAWTASFEEVFGYPVDGRYLAWDDPTGQTIVLTGVGFELDELSAIAEDLRPLSPQEWDDLRATTPTPSETPATGIIQGQGTPLTALEPGDPTPPDRDESDDPIPNPTTVEIGRGNLPDGREWVATATVELGVDDAAAVAGFDVTIADESVPLEVQLSPPQPNGTVDLHVDYDRGTGIVVGATTSRITMVAMTDRLGPVLLPLVTLPGSPLQFFANDWEATLPVPRNGPLTFTAKWGPDPDYTEIEFP